MNRSRRGVKASDNIDCNNKVKKSNNQPVVQWHVGNSKGGSVRNRAGCSFATAQQVATVDRSSEKYFILKSTIKRAAMA